MNINEELRLLQRSLNIIEMSVPNKYTADTVNNINDGIKYYEKSIIDNENELTKLGGTDIGMIFDRVEDNEELMRDEVIKELDDEILDSIN